MASAIRKLGDYASKRVAASQDGDLIFELFACQQQVLHLGPRDMSSKQFATPLRLQYFFKRSSPAEEGRARNGIGSGIRTELH